MNTDLIPFSYYNIEDTDQLGRYIKKTLETRHPEDTWIVEIINDLTSPLAKTQEAIGSTRKLQGTAEIRAADAEVDTAYLGLRRVVSDYELCPIPAKKEAAAVLARIFEQNDPQLYHRGYGEQAAKLNSLFADLKKPKAKAALEELGLTEWLAILENLLETLEGLRKERIQTVATTETPSDKLAKDELQTAISYVLEDINTLVRRNKVPGLAETDKLIETTAARITSKARARKTRRESGATDTDEQDRTTE